MGLKFPGLNRFVNTFLMLLRALYHRLRLDQPLTRIGFRAVGRHSAHFCPNAHVAGL